MTGTGSSRLKDFTAMNAPSAALARPTVAATMTIVRREGPTIGSETRSAVVKVVGIRGRSSPVTVPGVPAGASGAGAAAEPVPCWVPLGAVDGSARVPHWLQNFASSGLGAPQDGQYTRRTVLKNRRERQETPDACQDPRVGVTVRGL